MESAITKKWHEGILWVTEHFSIPSVMIGTHICTRAKVHRAKKSVIKKHILANILADEGGQGGCWTDLQMMLRAVTAGVPHCPSLVEITVSTG